MHYRILLTVVFFFINGCTGQRMVTTTIPVAEATPTTDCQLPQPVQLAFGGGKLKPLGLSKLYQDVAGVTIVLRNDLAACFMPHNVAGEKVKKKFNDR